MPTIKDIDSDVTVKFILALFNDKEEMEVKELQDRNEVYLKGEWKGKTAAGCANLPIWRNNPQFVLSNPVQQNISIFLTQYSKIEAMTYIGFYLVKSIAPKRKLLTMPLDMIIYEPKFLRNIDGIS